MAIEHQFVDQMAADKSRPSSHQNALSVLISPELDFWITTRTSMLDLAFSMCFGCLVCCKLLTSECKKSGCSEAEEDDLGHFELLMLLLLLLLVRSFSDLTSLPSVQALYGDGQVC